MSDLIGRKLGKYTLEQRLGEGGMAAVYSSHHPQFDRPVAIKILPPTIGQDASFQARFEREGRMIASLNHPSIIRVYDIDEADGLFYMVMDLLPGGTLENRLRDGSLDRRWSADVVVRMAEALDYAHGRGVVHRDIKPSNILLDQDGNPVLADFGIAKMVQGEGEANLTAVGTVMGTPAYMAPEQLTGQPPDARSDIYALGVVLYQLLAGRVPFTGDTMAVISGHLTRQPPALRETIADLPAAVEAVVLQALAKQPEHRFKSARVFAQALRNAAADLEPGMIKVAPAPPASAPHASPAATVVAGQSPAAPAAPAPPATAGQQVTRYLPVVLGVLGIFLLISIVAKYWALVVVLLLLLGAGGFAFLYFRARSAGRKAAAETTRAIAVRSATGSVAAAPPANDVPELPLASLPPTVVAVAELEPVQMAQPATEAAPIAQSDLPPTEMVPAATPATDDLPPTEMVPAATPATDDLPPTEVVPAATPATDDLLPTEMVPAATPATDDLPLTEVVPAATPATDDLPLTEMVPAAPPATDDLPPTESIPVSDTHHSAEESQPDDKTE